LRSNHLSWGFARLIELAQNGKRDPVQLREGAVKGI
jgi:hypothetical protein